MLRYTWIAIYFDGNKAKTKQFSSIKELNKWLKSYTDKEYNDCPCMTTIESTNINIIRIDPIVYYGLEEYRDIINLDTCSYYNYDDVELIVDYDNRLFFKLNKINDKYKAKQLSATEENDNGYTIIRISLEPGKKISTQKIIDLIINNKR